MLSNCKKLAHFNLCWNLNIDKSEEFNNCIEKLIEYDNDEHQKFIKGCNTYLNSVEINIVKKDNLNLFN